MSKQISARIFAIVPSDASLRKFTARKQVQIDVEIAESRSYSKLIP